MLPISPSAERAGLGVGLDAEHARRACAASSSAISSSDGARRRRRRRGTTTPATPGPRARRRPRPRRPVGSAERAGDGEVDRAAEQRRQRRAGGAGADVRELAQGVELEVGVVGVGHLRSGSFQAGAQAARARGCRSVSGVAVDDQGDLAVGRARRRRRRAPVGDVGGQRAGDELALADERRRRRARGAAVLRRAR